MERERWLQVYRLLRESDQEYFRGVFSAAAILGVYFWAVICDRPTSWACRRENWPVATWVGPLPSQATLSRRLRDVGVLALLNAVELRLRAADASSADDVKIIDAKPLPLGGHSKDVDSRWGHGVRNWSRGYKLFAIWTERAALPSAWRVAAMNVSEQAAAEKMIPTLVGRGYLLGDKLYDINKLYDAAGAVGHQLLAPRKRPQAGFGSRKHSPARLRGLDFLATPQGQTLHARRDAIERHFGGLTACGGGLGPLPSWVRRLRRVRLWLHAKILLNALRIRQLHPPPANA